MERDAANAKHKRGPECETRAESAPVYVRGGKEGSVVHAETEVVETATAHGKYENVHLMDYATVPGARFTPLTKRE